MIRLDSQLKGYKTKMILQVHDELVFETPDNEVDKIYPIIKETMEQTFKLDVPIVIESKIGQNWGQMKPLELVI